MTILMIIVFCVLMMMAVPVGYALIISAGVAVLFNGYLPLSIVAQQIYDQTQSFPMLALPFFMLAGTLMLGGELGRQLLELASHAMQRWRGGPCRPPSFHPSSSAACPARQWPMPARSVPSSSRGRRSMVFHPRFAPPTMPRRPSSTS